MKHKVSCAICGKIEDVEIDDKTGDIKSGWRYFGLVRSGEGRKKVEYWECPECLEIWEGEDYYPKKEDF